MSTGGQFTEQPRPPDPATHCPYCLARRITLAAGPCWQCQAPLPGNENPGQPTQAVDNANRVIIMALLALPFLGCFLLAPGPGIVFALGSLPLALLAFRNSSTDPQKGMFPVVLCILAMGFFFLACYIAIAIACGQMF